MTSIVPMVLLKEFRHAPATAMRVRHDAVWHVCIACKKSKARRIPIQFIAAYS